jgi:hypothetical protein
MSCRGLLFTLLLAGGALLAPADASAAPRETAPEWKDTVGPPAPMDVWLRRLVGKYEFDGMVEVVYYEDHRCAPLPPDPNSQDAPPPFVPYCSAIKGKGDCVGIGTGPGVQCVLNVSWEDLYEVISPTSNTDGSVNTDPVGVFNLPGGVSNLNPAMSLFGMDPGKQGINLLLVDNKGLPEGTMGVITGNRATFKTPCVNSPVLINAMKPQKVPKDERPLQTCDKVIYIDAKPDAKLLFLSIDFRINDEVFTRYSMSMRRTADAGTAVSKTDKKQTEPESKKNARR